MKHKMVSLIALGGLCLALWNGAARQALAAPLNANVARTPNAPVGIEVFQTSLAPYGRWFQHEKYGLVWTPTVVDVRWRPYTVGNWVYTDYGWTWNSDEDWGWATYHYGRWNFDTGIGWVWVPGYDWGPAWVSWRNGNDWLGWAPLPPEIVWDNGFVEVGLMDSLIPPFYYNFVEERYFNAPRLATYIAQAPRNVALIRETNNITRYEFINQRVLNKAFDTRRIEQATGQAVRTYRIEEAKGPNALRRFQADSGSVSFYRPHLERDNHPFSDENLRRQTEERRTLQQRQQEDRERLHQRHQQELNNPPHGLSPDNLNQRHAEELRELEQQHQRETQLLNNRHATGHDGDATPKMAQHRR
ncbi:MAG: hypothetical protein HYR56_20735 [Acidobacteria bacterium]|nr:hypothetical protein [Acidobacteriota bacterium]MBI3425914.1 hypothetical protein [Acidobacteriota bacterium]